MTLEEVVGLVLAEYDKATAKFGEADMRAIKRWQVAHSDRPNVELTWPDHADMVVWLLEESDRLHAALDVLVDSLSDERDGNDRLRDSISRALDETGPDPEPWGWTSPEISNAIIILSAALGDRP